MRKSLHTILVAAALVCGLAFTSCSVYDDRDSCPGWLTVCVARLDTPELAGKPLSVLVTDGAGVAADTVITPSDYPGGYDVEVIPGNVSLSAFVGGKTLMRDGSILSLPAGGEVDSLYTFAYDTCVDFPTTVCVEPLKDFCTLTVVVEGSEPWGGQGSWGVILPWNGSDMMTWRPVPGNHGSYMRYVGDGRWEYRIPRQGGYGQTLVFDGPSGGPFVIDLGKVMEEAGYDWGKGSLDDFTLYVREAEGRWTWDIAPWNDGGDRVIVV